MLLKLKSLEFLDLSGSDMSDDSYTYLGMLPQLRVLDLSFSSITEDGLRNLHGARNLDCLAINYTQIGDESIELIANMKLKTLQMNGCLFTRDGERQLSRMSPKTVYD